VENSNITSRSDTVPRLPAIGSDEVLVRVEGVSKKFCRSLKRSLWYGVCDIGAELNPFAKRGAWKAKQGSNCAAEGGSNQSVAGETSLRDGEFWAVNDVSFELRRGECLGLIGHNGAGKTTLLKMLNGLIKPDAGRIEMNGRVGALIALGAGFNPILTGRENVYIYGSVLGLDRGEIDGIIDEIIDFAEIREFIDMPLQSYSSGMAVRLGFAVASSLKPDILILDEVLAVGDIGFVVKCLNRLRDLAADAAVILVSHNMQSVAGFCSRVLFMDKSRAVVDTTDVGAAIDLYQGSFGTQVSSSGTGDVSILRCDLTGGEGTRGPAESGPREGVAKKIMLDFEVSGHARGSELQLSVSDESGTAIIAMPVMDSGKVRRVFPPGLHKICIPLDVSDLNTGSYHCILVFRDPDTRKIQNRSQGLAAFRVSAAICQGARVGRPVYPESQPAGAAGPHI
jgi:lipopolysaccharide transport system ATP-binding protein